MYLCFFFCKKINVEAREFSLTPTFIIEPKIIASALVTASYNIGAGLVAIIFFLYKDVVISDWQHTMYIFSLFSILLLVLWTMLAKDFSPNDENTHHQEEYKYKMH